MNPVARKAKAAKQLAHSEFRMRVLAATDTIQSLLIRFETGKPLPQAYQSAFVDVLQDALH